MIEVVYDIGATIDQRGSVTFCQFEIRRVKLYFLVRLHIEWADEAFVNGCSGSAFRNKVKGK